jgi:23S rRNA (adenine2503-C2)-methyltransferase
MENMTNGKNKLQLKGLTLQELQDYFISIGEPRFRGEQAFHWMYNRMASDFSEMNNIAKPLREKLDELATIRALRYVDSERSVNGGTVKFVFSTNDGNIIESVVIPEEKRNTLCVSTQVGCPLDCRFCATGLMGYKKNLHPGEIFDQYLLAGKFSDREITNLVFMGMGEPLLNFKNTVNALRIFSEELTTGISLKKVTVSTSGITPKIIELADMNLKVKLALSLHSCFDEVRSKIMPVNIKYPLKECLNAVKYYAKTTDTRITFEYVMLKGINDSAADIKALARLAGEIPSKINLIPFNSLKHMEPSGFAAELEPTGREEILKFADKLRDRNISVFLRETQGSDIAAACGQLAVKHQ